MTMVMHTNSLFKNRAKPTTFCLNMLLVTLFTKSLRRKRSPLSRSKYDVDCPHFLYDRIGPREHSWSQEILKVSEARRFLRIYPPFPLPFFFLFPVHSLSPLLKSLWRTSTTFLKAFFPRPFTISSRPTSPTSSPTRTATPWASYASLLLSDWVDWSSYWSSHPGADRFPLRLQRCRMPLYPLVICRSRNWFVVSVSTTLISSLLLVIVAWRRLSSVSATATLVPVWSSTSTEKITWSFSPFASWIRYVSTLVLHVLSTECESQQSVLLVLGPVLHSMWLYCYCLGVLNPSPSIRSGIRFSLLWSL